MKIFMTPLVAFVLLCPSCSSKWTTHTACKDDKLELLYQSCGESGYSRICLYYHLKQAGCRLALGYIFATKGLCTITVFVVVGYDLYIEDPLQDFGFSVDHCNNPLSENVNIRFGIILRYDINELFLDINLFSMQKSIFSFSYPVCEVDFPKFSFCGRKKGEKIYYAGKIDNPSFPIGKGEYHILLRLHNENNFTITCANITVISY